MGSKALLVALLVFVSARAEAITQVACLGDSITYTASNRAPIPYPHQLEHLLNEASPGQYAVSNFGTPGHRSDQNLSTWTNYIRGRGYDVLVLLTGINDIVQDVTGANAWTSVNQIVDEAKSDGLTVILVTTLPFKGYSGWTSGRQTQLDALLTSIRAEGGLTLLDLYPSWETSAGSDIMKAAYDVGDGLHPGVAGTAQLASDVYGAINP
jgi:lysophospholipase L1-like esterase